MAEAFSFSISLSFTALITSFFLLFKVNNTATVTAIAVINGIATESPMMSPKLFPLHLFPIELDNETPSEFGWLIACELIVSQEDPL